MNMLMKMKIFPYHEFFIYKGVLDAGDVQFMTVGRGILIFYKIRKKD
jgi:hypothetical protein